MTEHQTLDELKVVYIAWKMGAVIQTRYKPSQAKDDIWTDHTSYESVAENEELSVYYLHDIVCNNRPPEMVGVTYGIKGAKP